ncbi:MAG: amidase family protein [Acidobacteriota bacterium]
MSKPTRRQFVQGASGLAAAASLGRGQGLAAQTDELSFASAGELADKVRRREVSSVELTQHFIDRIERFDGTLNAVVVRDFGRALEAAKAADAAVQRGEELGPLHGVPMTIKESYDIEGLPSTWGLPPFAASKAPLDSVVVDRFQAAGAHFLGKTNVPINLGDFQSYNAIYGATNNPWDTTRTPGGSSGGSAAALAAGLTGLESGSDIGGSIRNPAHFCGVYGHKPTHGIVPMRGHQPPGVPPGAQPPDLAVVGPLARSAEDLATAMDIVSGPDVLQSAGWKLDLPAPRATSLGDLRVALWPDDPLAPVSTEVSDRVQAIGELLAQKGATVSDSARPKFPTKMSHDTYLPLLGAMTEGPESEIKFFDWFRFHGMRGGLRLQWRQFFEDWDIVLCPISAVPAFPQDQSEPLFERTLQIDGETRPYFEQVFWAGLATVSYLPSTVFPTGLSSQGLPIGLQAMSGELFDRTTIEFARLMAQEIGGFSPPPDFAG